MTSELIIINGAFPVRHVLVVLLGIEIQWVFMLHGREGKIVTSMIEV